MSHGSRRTYRPGSLGDGAGANRLAARARARKKTFETLAAGLSNSERDTLVGLLAVDPELRSSRFAWWSVGGRLGHTTASSSTLAIRMSPGRSRYTGPGLPETAIRKGWLMSCAGSRRRARPT
jgi:hypothetical protein